MTEVKIRVLTAIPAPSMNEAIKTGSVQFEGNPCRKCGSTVKYTCSSSCVVCKRVSGARLRKLARIVAIKAAKSPKIYLSEDAIAAAYKGERYDNRKARIEP